MREGIEAGVTDAAVETRWSPDGFDPSGEIRSLLRASYPENTTPVRLMEYLIDQGLRQSQPGWTKERTVRSTFLTDTDAAPTHGCVAA